MEILDLISQQEKKRLSTSKELSKISLFYHSRRNSGFSRYTYSIKSIKKIIKSEKTQKEIDEIISKSKHRHYYSVTFTGTFNGANEIDNFKTCSRLCWLSFINLPIDKRDQIINALQIEPTTHLLFKTLKGVGLNLIVKIDFDQPEEHKNYFDQLCQYYQKKFDLKNGYVDYRCKYLNTLCHLPYDPDVYYNPDSDLSSLPNQLVQESFIDGAGQFEDMQSNVILYDATALKQIAVQHTAFDFSPKYYQSKLPTIQKNCSEKFLQILGEKYNLGQEIRSTVNWNSTNQNFELEYYTVSNNKKDDCVDFVYDVHLDTAIISERKIKDNKATVRKKKAPITDVCESLLTLLDNQELEQGTVQRQLAEIHKCSYETIRDRVEDILKKPVLIRETTGKPYVLVKRLKRPNHFLSLNAVN